jgi:hypothetical protein
MSQFRLRFSRAYQLKPICQREDNALALVRIGGSDKSVALPYSPNLDYVVAPRGVGELTIDSRDFRVEMPGVLGTLWARPRLAFLVQERKFLLPNDTYPEDLSCMGVPANKFQLELFGGTMFWVCPEP